VIFVLFSISINGVSDMTAQRFSRRDASLKKTKALPSGASSVYSDPINMESGSKGAVLVDGEFLITAPAAAVGELANTETLVYFLQDAPSDSWGSARALSGTLITQTGAGGAGAAAQTRRFRPPTDCQKYVRLGCTKTGGTGNASTMTVILELLT